MNERSTTHGLVWSLQSLFSSMHVLPHLTNEISSASVFGNSLHIWQIRMMHLIELGEPIADDTKVSLSWKRFSLPFLTKMFSHAFWMYSTLACKCNSTTAAGHSAWCHRRMCFGLSCSNVLWLILMLALPFLNNLNAFLKVTSMRRISTQWQTPRWSLTLQVRLLYGSCLEIESWL